MSEKQATREAKARDYKARVEAALEAIKQQRASKKGADKEKVRPSACWPMATMPRART